MIVFLYPLMLVLLALPFMVRLLFKPIEGIYGDALRIPFVKDFNAIENIANKNQYSVFMPTTSILNLRFWLWFVVWFLVVLALARPVQIGTPERIKNESRDILMVTDISTSMLEEDFTFQGKRLDRLSAVKAVVDDFINRRSTDRLGLILFGTRAYLQAPLTFDRNSVKNILWTMDAGMAGNSTAIGDALGLALKTLKDNTENNKVIILLTDGENNDGKLSLPQAIDMARREGVKVYTIGVGGGGFSLANAFFGIKNSPLDEQSLKQLADETKGRYFRADDLNSLVKVYREIDKLEPTEQEQNFIYPQEELYYLPLLLATILATVLAYHFRKGGR